MREGIQKLHVPARAHRQLSHLEDKSMAFNTARIEALELENLFEVAEATAIAAEGRTESRGAHARQRLTPSATTSTGCAIPCITRAIQRRWANARELRTEDRCRMFEPKVRTY